MIHYNELLPCFGDIYDNLKTKQKDSLLIAENTSFALISLLEMFQYGNLPPTLHKNFIEITLLQTGKCFIWRNENDDIISSPGTLSGEPDVYGMGTTCIATTMNGQQKTGARDVDIVVGFNNDIFTSENNFITWFNHIMSEINISIDHCVKYSRLLPAPIVKDEKTKRAFDTYITKLLDGDMTAVLSDNLLNNENGIESNVLQITDDTAISRVQYLSRLYDDMLKRFYNRYGQALQTLNKSAQTTTDELHGWDSVSFILPMNMLKCRREMVDKINNVFGTNITVDFSEIWRHEYDKYKTDGTKLESDETKLESDETE